MEKKTVKEQRIIIIDDDRFIKRAIKANLEKHNSEFVVDEAADYETGLVLLKSHKYKCILLDYYIGDMNGIEMLEKFKEEKITAPVVMLTGAGDEMIAVKALKAGAYDYIPKKILNDPNFSDMLSNSIYHAIDMYIVKMDSIRARQSLELREERYRSLVENSPILILRFFPDDAMISFVNDGFCSYYNLERFDVLGENFFQYINEDFHDKAVDIIKSISRDKPVSNIENLSIINNEKRWQFWTVQGIFDDEGNTLEYQCMGEDITNLKKAEMELKNQKLYLQSILDTQDNMIVVTDKKEMHLANKSFTSFFGYDKYEDLKADYRSISDLSQEMEGYEPCNDMASWIDATLESENDHMFIVFKHEKSQLPRIFSAYTSRMFIDADDIERYVIAFTDVTSIEMKSRNFEIKASFDSLTGIINRGKFYEILAEEVEFAQRKHRELSLIFFDIDHFKKINDTYGHKTGDSVLKQLSELININIRESDFFARWGGEEFVILMTGTGLKGAAKTAEKIRALVDAYKFKDIDNLTCSFGVSSLGGSDSGESFLERADKALYRAKEGGRNMVVGMKKKEDN